MNLMNKFPLACLATVLLVAPSTFGQSKKEIIKATKTVRGTFLGFEVGDYVHAVIKDTKGQERSFYIGGPGLDFYLAKNVKKSGTFTFQVVNCFIEEAGGRMDIERMKSARIGSQSSEAWWKSIRKKMSLDSINKKFEPLVGKATLNGG